MAKKIKKASRIFNIFLKLTLGIYLRAQFRYKAVNDRIKDLKPPYIVIANHTNFWDPFLLSMCIPSPVHFVTSDAYFNNPVLRFLLVNLLGAIPKTKSVTDPQAIRHILSLVKSRGVIGIYAEGRRNWDGTTLPLLYPTAKLIKSLKIPVVSVLFKGGCLSMPRWAKKTRRGKVVMDCSLVFDGEAIKKLSADEIYAGISASLAHDEYKWQRAEMNTYRGTKLAQRLELFLFACPECKSEYHMKSRDDIFFCQKCGYTVRYDEYGFFKPVSGGLHFDNPRDWNVWQLRMLESEIRSRKDSPEAGSIIENGNIQAYRGSNASDVIERLDTGSLYLYGSKVVFKGDGGGDHQFEMAEIYGENIQYNDIIEFYHGKTLYRFGGGGSPVSAYKWVRALEMLKSREIKEDI